MITSSEGAAITSANVTPSDSTLLFPVPRAVYVGVAGNLNVGWADGSNSVFIAVAAGSTLPIRPTKIFSTSTTASSILALN